MKSKLLQSLFVAASIAVPMFLVAGVAGCAGSKYERSTGEYIDDKGIASRVSGALHDNEAYKFDDVEVKSFRGTVQLSGFVNTVEQKKKAGEIAEKVQGVKNVENGITVKDEVKK